MTDNEILATCKTMLFGSTAGTFRDGLLLAYIAEVKSFMLNAGVSQNVINSNEAVGVIALGVNDLWNYQAGGVKLSEYFKQRVIQLTRVDDHEPVVVTKTFKAFKQYIKTTAAETNEIVFDIPQYEHGDDVEIYINGMLIQSGVDYTLNGSTVTFTIPKIADTEIIVSVNKIVSSIGGA